MPEPTALLYTTAPTDYDAGTTTTLRVAGRDARGQGKHVALGLAVSS